ncbi:MAG TPA: hypothetical protein VGV38_01150, partial [Pyrinomonadaceae bacterium]|nr:hypothetical protein [Pyrinomonadaceae bacterium]
MARPRVNPIAVFLRNRAPALSLALAAAVAALAFSCGWMYGETRRLREELGQTRLALQRQAEQQKQQGGQALPSPTAEPPAPTSQPTRERTPEVAG